MTTVIGRIPASLQAIFTASNKGEEVYEPPKDDSAFKVFQRGGSNQKPRKPIFAAFSSTPCLPFSIANVPPQGRFHLKLKSRGYSPRNFASKRTGYYNRPTEHQRASYGQAMIDCVRQNKVEEFRMMLEAGLSPNACNQHGESLLHMVCRQGKTDLFNILVAHDVDIQQSDDYGRTCLHDCCWASNPSFEIAKALLQRDPSMLFLFDARGSLPLTYVTKSLWGKWNYFMEHNIMDEVFPTDKDNKDATPVLCTLKPDSRPVPDPKDKIPEALASAVATGVMAPYELVIAMGAYEDASTVNGSLYDYDSEDFSEDDEEEDADFDSDEEEELFRITGQIGNTTLGRIAED